MFQSPQRAYLRASSQKNVLPTLQVRGKLARRGVTNTPAIYSNSIQPIFV
jgi:hypothetical protein